MPPFTEAGDNPEVFRQLDKYQSATMRGEPPVVSMRMAQWP
jgi:hypothetical protein